MPTVKANEKCGIQLLGGGREEERWNDDPTEVSRRFYTIRLKSGSQVVIEWGVHWMSSSYLSYCSYSKEVQIWMI